MVAQRRFLPLVGVLVLGLLALAARLVQVQVFEAPVWGREAANLVRSSNVIPYHRGVIRDRNGIVLAQDADLYEVEFEYRSFRRGHALGQVAHARSALELRAVPLTEALEHLEEWAVELVSITPDELAAFARGEALALGGVRVGSSAEPELEQRSQRAADVRWYVGALLGLDERGARALRPEAEDEGRAHSFVELAAERAKKSTKERLLAELGHALTATRTDLAELATLLADDLATIPAQGSAGASSVASLVGALEARRRAVEDQSADLVFESAAGFAPGRLSARALAEDLDLRWIAALLRWDAARAKEWASTRRERWRARLDALVVPRIFARAVVEEEQGRKRASARLLDGLAELYRPRTSTRERGAPPSSWTELDELAVLDELDGLFDGARLPVDERDFRAVLPLNDPELQEASVSEDDPWLDVALATELADAHAIDPEAPANAAEASARWNALAEKRLAAEDPEGIAELARLVHALEARFLAAIDRALLALREEKGGAPLAFAKARLDLALQQEKSLQKDLQSRAVLLRADPDYALVNLIERHPERYRGFEVRETTRRVHPLVDGDAEPFARALLGGVRKPSLEELFAQIRDQRRFDALKYQMLRSADEDEELAGLNARLFRADEWTGGAGVEDYFDPELRGQFGWREVRGLAGRDELTIGEPPIDGKDLDLTLDVELQKAAQAVLEDPELPPQPTDKEWFQNPVGAIVLLTVDGEVLAAASVPSKKGEPIPGRDREREYVRERTLTRPTFNPPGSVFKPFVAAFALDKLGFDASLRFRCTPLKDGDNTGGYGDLHCSAIHHECDLSRALTVSCNCFFAHVGECYTTDELLAMAATFGFGEPTGIRAFGASGRSGLREDWRLPMGAAWRKGVDVPSGKRRFANGLSFVEATPMQVARATAGLATGWLPDVAIVRRVDGVPVPKKGRAVGLSEASLAFVRGAMDRVVTDAEGSAHGKGLDLQKLGFSVAAKTGSADYAAIRKGLDASEVEMTLAAKGSVRKHTWVTGWFPADHPRAVFVIYLHDLLYTSSHTAVYVAAQFLRQEAVKAWLARTLEQERAAEESR
ncbi:MAG: hypothetical protein HZA53_02105 [Planctomycetes bacterium]|nr:hypothetical protein [Planctomycetota bacterium]